MHEKYCYGMTTTLMIGSGVQLDPTLKSSLDLIQQEYQEDDISEYINIQDNSRMNFEDVEEEEEDDDDDDDDDEDDEYDDIHDPFDRPSSRLGLNMSRRRRISDVSVDAPSYAQLELEAIYLTAQNEKLERELEASRQTIQALKLIIASKDDALRKAAEDYQQAIMKVQVMEAVILSKHARSGSIIVRSGTSIAPITSAAQDNLLQLKTQITPPEPLEHFRSPEISSPPAPTIIAAPQEPVQPSSRLTIPQSNQPSSRLTISEVQSNQRPTKSQTLQPKKLRKKQPQPPPQAKSRPTIKHQRRWSMDFGPKSRLINDEDVDDGNLSESNGGADTLSNTTGTYVASCHSPSTSVDSTLTPNTDRQRRRPFIHSFTCHPSGNKHGFDLSPPSTPSSELSCDESSSDVSEDDDDEDVVVPSVSRYEKHSMPRKFFSSPLRIFSSTR